MAIFTRHESEGRLHYEVMAPKLYNVLNIVQRYLRVISHKYKRDPVAEQIEPDKSILLAEYSEAGTAMCAHADTG